VIQQPRGELQARLQILGLQVRYLFEDLLAGQSSREQVEHVADANPHSANTGAATALLRINGDALGERVHGRNYMTLRDEWPRRGGGTPPGQPAGRRRS